MTNNKIVCPHCNTEHKCVNCGRVEEVCRDGYCRDCHVSISFEDCMSNTWLNKWSSNTRSEKFEEIMSKKEE